MAIDSERFKKLFPNGGTADEIRSAGFSDSDIEELENLQVQRLIDKVSAMNLPTQKPERVSTGANKS